MPDADRLADVWQLSHEQWENIDLLPAFVAASSTWTCTQV